MSLRQFFAWRWTCDMCGETINGQVEVAYGSPAQEPDPPAGWTAFERPPLPPWVACPKHRKEGRTPMSGSWLATEATTPKALEEPTE